MSGPHENTELSQKRPDHKLVALLADRSSVSSAMRDLEGAGLDTEEVLVLHGPEGIERFDADGGRHGWWAHLRRSIKNVGGADANILELYLEGLERGRFLVFVPVHQQRPEGEIVAALRRHGAHAMTFFTRGAMESIPSLER